MYVTDIELQILLNVIDFSSSKNILPRRVCLSPQDHLFYDIRYVYVLKIDYNITGLVLILVTVREAIVS